MVEWLEKAFETLLVYMELGADCMKVVKTCVRVNGKPSDGFLIDCVRQGCITSSWLFTTLAHRDTTVRTDYNISII